MSKELKTEVTKPAAGSTGTKGFAPSGSAAQATSIQHNTNGSIGKVTASTTASSSSKK